MNNGFAIGRRASYNLVKLRIDMGIWLAVRAVPS
jgi:hypothetical protein